MCLNTERYMYSFVMIHLDRPLTK